MKPLDLIQLYADFKVSMAGDAIPNEVKLLVAEEVFNSLPPVAFCAHSPHTRDWLGAAIQAEIDALRVQHNERTNTEAAKAATEQAKTVPERQARKKSVGKQD